MDHAGSDGSLELSMENKAKKNIDRVIKLDSQYFSLNYRLD